MSHFDAGAAVDFDLNGPRLGSLRLLIREPIGFTSPTSGDLTEMFPNASLDVDRLQASLKFIADAMNKGDVALAAVATSRLRLPEPKRREGDMIAKASSDDPKHPGYPAGEPEGKGGQFRPKDVSTSPAQQTSEKVLRQAKRRSIRLALRRVLTTKRLLRLLGENAAAVLTEAVPGLDAVVTAATVADDLALLRDLANDLADAEPAVELAEKGPVELDSLKVDGEEVSFNSFAEFKKVDLEKQFGPAGQGLDYHHIVEQGPNAGLIPQAELQSTENIVKIPRLLHEDINSFYSTPRFYDNEFMTPRNYLKGQSFEDQKAFGIGVLRKIGAIR